MPRFDAVIVGAGPAGSTAALCLARAGARVALVDRRTFPRDKACGDLVGPRGVRLLAELGVAPGKARRVGDLMVIGPSGRRILLPALPGVDYPGYALAISRMSLDRALFEAAVAAGAHPVRDLFVGLTGQPQHPTGVQLANSGELGADTIVGADGATSRVATAAGLVEDQHALWGFALRALMRKYLAGAAALQEAMLARPRLASAGMRLITAPPLRSLVAGTWSLYWNGLVDGAVDRPSARAAALVQTLTWQLARRRAPDGHPAGSRIRP